MTRLIQVGTCAILVCFAATGSPAPGAETPAAQTADQAWEQLKTWDYGQSRRPLATLELAIARETADPAQRRRIADRLTAVIADPQATEAARLFACQQLPLVAGDAQVPALARLLDDPKTADMARRTLESIPGEAALEAIRAAVPRLQGTALVGAINSLGVRRDASSIRLLAPLVGGDPQVAAAAVLALARIGTPEAVAAMMKAETDKRLMPVFFDAVLRAADGLAARGNLKDAAELYKRVLAGEAPRGVAQAALAGMVKADKAWAMPRVISALSADDPFVQATALRLVRQLPGEEATAALLQQLDRLKAPGQAMVLDILGERGDKSAAGAVVKRLDDKEDAVRAAAARAMARLGDASTVDLLAGLAASDKGTVRQAARESLVRLAGADVDKRLLAACAEGSPAVRAEVFLAMASRRTSGATALLLKAAGDADEQARTAAFDALAVLGQAEDYASLVQLLVAAKGTSEAAERAVLSVGGRLATVADRASPLLAALKAGPAEAKPPLLRLLASCGGADALQAVKANLADADAAVRDAATRALANWPDESAADDLMALVKGTANQTHRVLAMRGYLRLAGVTKDEAARVRMLSQVRPIATTADSKRMLLAGLADVPGPAALDMAMALVGDGDVQAEATAATLKIARALAQTNRTAVQTALAKAKESSDRTVAEQGAAILAQALASPEIEPSAAALRYDKPRSEALKNALAKRAPKGWRLVCYLDCGPDTADGAKGGPQLRVVGANRHLWPGADAVTIVHFGTVAWDGQQVLFEARDLNPKKAYQFGFSWWDFDHDTRVESVWMATGKGQRETKVLDRTKLPSGATSPAAEKNLLVPPELYADGTLRIMFRNESAPNAVVSEAWLWEAEAEGPPPANAAPASQPAVTKPAPGKALRKVVIVTGMEYPGHPWKQTAPAMAELLRQDGRMGVEVVEDARFLASPDLAKYDAVFLNYMNWESPDPGPDARTGLQRFVEGGKGLVLMHFACGAFQAWPEFRNLAGRVWDPKLRGHDPHGAFRVEIANPDHPITKGMKPFETIDELYTCLTGDRPIEVLATAKSKVDGKDYPMAFVLTCGKGRVFHSVLGHDVRAITPPGVAELFRRGTAWAAGLPPVAPQEK
jgi:type 1 glutamine amidotransferase/HEAT repeat protein